MLQSWLRAWSVGRGVSRLGGGLCPWGMDFAWLCEGLTSKQFKADVGRGRR